MVGTLLDEMIDALLSTHLQYLHTGNEAPLIEARRALCDHISMPRPAGVPDGLYKLAHPQL